MMIETAGNGSQGKKKKTLGREKKRLIFYICVMALPVTQFCIFYLFMNINSMLLAFRKFDVASNGYIFAGFENFKNVFTGTNSSGVNVLNEILISIKNSLIIYGFSTVIGVTFGLVFSYAIYKKIPAHSFFKIILFLPHVLSIVVMVILYKYFVSEALPQMMPSFTKLLTGEAEMGLLSTSKTVTLFGTMLFFALFTSFGTSVLMYTGAMNGISDSVIEAGKIDGTTPFKEFWHIVLPSIYPTLVTFIVVGIASIFTNQMHLYSFYGDGADMRLSTIGYYLFKYTSKANASQYPQLQYPYLSAFGIVMTFIAVPITLGARRLLEKFGPRSD